VTGLDHLHHRGVALGLQLLPRVEQNVVAAARKPEVPRPESRKP